MGNPKSEGCRLCESDLFWIEEHPGNNRCSGVLSATMTMAIRNPLRLSDSYLSFSVEPVATLYEGISAVLSGKCA